MHFMRVRTCRNLNKSFTHMCTYVLVEYMCTYVFVACMCTYVLVVDCVVRQGKQRQRPRMRRQASVRQPSGLRWVSLSAPVPRQTMPPSVTAVHCPIRRRRPVRSSAEKRTSTSPSNNNASDRFCYITCHCWVYFTGNGAI